VTRPADLARLSSAASPRARLINGFEVAVAAKGFAATTIGDIVRTAQVSKRTFYEHFPDKEACFLASYLACTERVLTAMTIAVDTKAPWRQQVRAVVQAYLSQLQSKAALTQTFFLEIQAAGSQAMKMRQDVYQRFNDMIRGLVAQMRQSSPQLQELSSAMATAVVGGINALVLLAAETGRADRLLELEDTATERPPV
jgi:AcrR family transcriptional regulator